MGDGQDNNFNALRFWAATAVLFSHSFPLGAGLQDPLQALTNDSTSSIGSVAVIVFFVISGYLIASSYDRSNDPLTFIWCRILRIFPGLIVALLVIALIIGPIFTTLPLADYFSDPATYRFTISNLPVFLYPSDSLPSLFMTNPFPGKVSGSLWTLGFEFRCYLLVLLLGVTRLLNLPVAMVLFGVATAIVAFVSRSHFLLWYAAYFSGAFMAGAIYFLCRLKPAAVWVWISVAGIGMCMAFRVPLNLALMSAGAYLTLSLATAKHFRVPHLARFGDLSYGIYVYAFTVQQSIAHLMGSWSTWYFNAAIALPVVLLLAAASWNLVERRALLYKSIMRSARRRTAEHEQGRLRQS